MHDICERATPKVSAVGAGPVGAVGAIRPMAGLHSLASAAVPAGGGAPTMMHGSEALRRGWRFF